MTRVPKGARLRTVEYLPFWCLYTHQGLITSLVLQGVVGYFRHQGLDLQTLSLLWLTMLPWAGKAFWAPFAERHALASRGNRYLGSLLMLQLSIAATLAGIGALAPTHGVFVLFVALLFLTFLSASHDIFADGITIGTTNATERPAANVAQVGGSYVGLLSGAAIFLALTQHIGWTGAWLCLAAVSAGLTIPIVAFVRPLAGFPLRQARPRFDWRSFRPLWPALALTGVFYLAMRGVLALQTVLVADQGVSLARLGLSLGALNTMASGAGVLIGGVLARQVGAVTSLRIVMVAQAAIIVFAAALASRLGVIGWFAILAIANVAAAAGFVVLYNLLMGLVRPEQPASDYALFQSIDALVSMLVSLAILRFAAAFGYPAALALLAFVAIAAMWPIHRLCRRVERSKCLETHVPVESVRADGR